MYRSLVCPLLVCTFALLVLTAPLVAEEPSAEASKESDATTYQLAYKFVPGQVVQLFSDYQAQLAIHFKQAAENDKNSTQLWKQYEIIDVAEDGSGILELRLNKFIRAHAIW